MTITTKEQAIAAIRKGLAAQVLPTLLQWRVSDPHDRSASYLYAWALEEAGFHAEAAGVWDTCRGPEPEADPPIEAVPIKYTYELAANLVAVWTLDGGDDPIDQMIAHLNAAPASDSPEIDPSLMHDLVDLDDESTIVSPTFGRILVAQHKYAEAAVVYRRLAEGSPDQRDTYLAEAERLTLLAQTMPGS
ncbi:MAG: hypothetical protein OXM02_07740 [Bacteroidota bacterium]|nr:hypothetical protein [Bacteroidota bacterium]